MENTAAYPFHQLVSTARTIRSIYTLLLGICFTISLAAQDTLFFENFDATPGTKPSGWTTELEAGDSRWQFVNGGGTKNPSVPGSRRPPSAYSDTVNALYFFESLEGESVILVTPPVNLEFAIRPELRIMHVQREGNLGFGAAHDELRVYFKTGFDSTWREVNKIAEYTDEVFDWTQQTIILPEAAFVPECYFAFKATTNYGWGVGIDDVCVVETEVQQRVVDQVTVYQESTNPMASGSRNNPILRLNVSVSGNTGTLTMTSLAVQSMNTADSDIRSNGVKLFCNYVNKDFYAATLVDSASYVSGTASFGSLDLNLPSGHTNLWIAYDLETDAVHGHVADAMFQAGSIQIGGNTYPSSSASPAGNRAIREAVFYDNFSSDKGWVLEGDFERGRPGGLGGYFLGNPDPVFASGDTMILGNDLTGLGLNPGDYEASVARYDNLATMPEIDLFYYNDVKLSFLKWLNVANNDTASIEMSTDGGNSWNEVWNNDNNVIADGDWKQFILSLPAAERQQQVSLRFNLGPTTPTDHLSGWNIENLAVTGNYVEYDVGPVALLTPGAGCGHSSAETVRIRVKNFGPDATPSAIPVRYSFNGGATFTEDVITQSIPWEGEFEFDFSQTVDLSTPGEYHVIIETTLGVDEAPENNLLDTVLFIDPVYTLPYIQSFESGRDFWRTEGVLPTFEHGVPLGSIIHTAASGTRAWVTNLDGVYNNNEDSYLVGPCFDFSRVDYPIFECKLYYITEEDKDGARLEYSLDNGITWARVGNMGDGDAYDWNWYNSDGITALDGGHGWTGGPKTWTTARIMLDTTVFRNMPAVKFRFHFSSDASGRTEGIGIDDIHIYDINRDVGVVSIEYPVDGCIGMIGDHVGVTVRNFGLDTLMAGQAILVGYDLDSAATVIDTLVLTSDLLSGSSVPFVFSAPLEVTSVGMKYIEAFTLLEDDINFYNETVTNDTTSKSFEVVPVPFMDLPSAIFTVRPDTLSLDASTGYPGDVYLWQDGSTDPVFQVTVYDDGIYYATASNSYCSYSDTTHVHRLIADIGVSEITEPLSACELGASVMPTIMVKNHGSDTLRAGAEIPVRYQIDADPVIGELAILASDLLPDSTFEFTFSSGSDMTAVKVYTLTAFTALDHDDTLANDSRTVMIEAFGFTPVDLGPDTVVRGLEYIIDAGGGYDSYLWQDGSTGQTLTADTSGTYRITVQQGTMCPGTDTLILTLLVPDVAVHTLMNPTSGCKYSDSERVEFYLLNSGTDTLDVIDTLFVSWQLDAGAPVTDTLTVDRRVEPGDSILYASDVTVDLSTNGIYQLAAEVVFIADLVTENNDTLMTLEVYDPPVISLGPDTILNSKHYLLDPGAGFAAYLWQDGSTGQQLEASSDHQAIDSLYSVTVMDINGCQASDTVRVAFDFRDVGIAGLISPVSACVLSDREQLSVLTVNYGTHTLVNDTIILEARVNMGSTVQMQHILTQPLDPGDSIQLTFPHFFDLGLAGDNLFRVHSVLSNDVDPVNDTLEAVVSHYGEPAPQLAGGSDTVDTGLPYTLDAGSGFLSYFWNGIEGDQIYEASGYGWITVTVSGPGGCTGRDSVYLFSSTGFDTHVLPGELQLFPVPADLFFHMEYRSQQAGDLLLEIFDPSGRKILLRRYQQVSEISEKLDVSVWGPGIYYLRLRSEDAQITRTISVNGR